MPPSDIPGEELSPTQPFPTKPPAFDRQGVTEDDLIDFTPELKTAGARDSLALQVRRLFTPPSLYKDDIMRGTINLPTGKRLRELERVGRGSGHRLSLRAVEDDSRA